MMCIFIFNIIKPQHHNLLLLNMRKTIRKDRLPVQNCGGKKKGSCNVWAGDTIVKTKIKVLA